MRKLQIDFEINFYQHSERNFKMNILQAKNEIINTVHAYLSKDAKGGYVIPSIRQRPVLLMGPPGIGKTQIMEQIADECQIGLVSYTITHHTRQSAVGLPMIGEEEYDGQKYSVTEYTMSEIIAGVHNCIKYQGKREGILFIDEINCVSETLVPMMLQFLQCKTFGNQKLPDGWIIVAAGNPHEYNKSVREFDMVTLDRVRRITVEADLAVWKQYAAGRHIHGSIVSYLDIRPKNFYRISSDVDGLNFVTARGWEDMSSLMFVYEKMGAEITYDVVHEFLQDEEVARDFTAYYDLYNKYKDDYRVSEILDGTADSTVYQRAMKAGYDEKMSLVNLILDGIVTLVDEKNEAGGNVDNIAKIDNAISFIEAALESSQMLVFVTGLSMNGTTGRFLMEHKSDKYTYYSKTMLQGGERAALLEEINKIE
jgi:hypothetical protein